QQLDQREAGPLDCRLARAKWMAHVTKSFNVLIQAGEMQKSRFTRRFPALRYLNSTRPRDTNKEKCAHFFHGFAQTNKNRRLRGLARIEGVRSRAPSTFMFFLSAIIHVIRGRISRATQ